MKAPYLTVRNVSKLYKFKQTSKDFFSDFFLPSYQSFRALDDVSFDVKAGEKLGLLGPNGAGKTTLMKCLCGLTNPNEGTILIDGKPVESALSSLGVMLSNSFIYHRLTGYDNLKFFAQLYGIRNPRKKIASLAEFFGIAEWIDNYVENYSLGMKSKLAMARAMINDPALLLLDEPSLGLDPHSATVLRKKIKSLDQTVIITTHYMEEAEELCDRVAILHKGKIIAIDSVGELKKLVEKDVVVEVVVSGDDSLLLKELRQAPFVQSVLHSRHGFRIFLNDKAALSELLSVLGKYDVARISEEAPTLSDVFLKLTGGIDENII